MGRFGAAPSHGCALQPREELPRCGLDALAGGLDPGDRLVAATIWHDLGVDVRTLRADEVSAWRDVRLRALADSPSAFATTYEESASWGLDVWAARVERLAPGDQSVMFVADDGGTLVGIAGGYVDPENPGIPQLISMWVAPEARGQGLGRQLVEAVAGWARARGFRSIHLFITTGNESAAAMYERCGFIPTGHTIPLPRDPRILELEMRRELP